MISGKTADMNDKIVLNDYQNVEVAVVAASFIVLLRYVLWPYCSHAVASLVTHVRSLNLVPLSKCRNRKPPSSFWRVSSVVPFGPSSLTLFHSAVDFPFRGFCLVMSRRPPCLRKSLLKALLGFQVLCGSCPRLSCLPLGIAFQRTCKNATCRSSS